MNFRKIIKIAVSVFVCAAIMFGTVSAYAASESSLKSQISALESKQKELKKTISKLKSEKAPIEQQKKVLDRQISNLEDQIAVCTKAIYKLDAKIEANNREIAQCNEEINANKELFRRRLRAIYMSGGNSELMLALDSSTMSDYLAKTELTKSVSARDNALMEKLLADVERIGKLNAEIEAKKAEQKDIKKTLSAKQSELQKQMNEVDKSYQAVSKKYSNAVNSLDSYQSAIEDLYAEIKSLNKVAEGQNITFSGMFIWPCPGYYHISSPYGYRWGRLHRGTDISSSGIAGKQIIAAASGTVLKSGYHYSYGNYVVINHGMSGGKLYYTLYAHMKSTPLVSAGQHVNQGQTLGYVGSTGNSTGAHLHFEVQVNGTAVNAMNYF